MWSGEREVSHQGHFIPEVVRVINMYGVILQTRVTRHFQIIDIILIKILSALHRQIQC